jgi:hypothetical protein
LETFLKRSSKHWGQQHAQKGQRAPRGAACPGGAAFSGEWHRRALHIAPFHENKLVSGFKFENINSKRSCRLFLFLKFKAKTKLSSISCKDAMYVEFCYAASPSILLLLFKMFISSKHDILHYFSWCITVHALI